MRNKRSWEEFRKLKGCISKDSLDILREGREIDRKAEESVQDDLNAQNNLQKKKN